MQESFKCSVSAEANKSLSDRGLKARLRIGRVCCDGMLPSKLVAVRPSDFGSSPADRARAAWSALCGAAEHDQRLRRRMIEALDSVGLCPGGGE